MPVFVRYCHLLYDLLDVLISSLYGAIHLWPVRGRVMVFNFELRAEFSNHLVVQISTIISDNSFRRQQVSQIDI